MQCEVCGRQIFGKPRNVIIEGAKMIACGSCAKLGSGYWETPPPIKPSIRREVKPPKRIPMQRRRTVSIPTLELVEDFNVRIRTAREKLGFSHEDLGKRIGEKVSVLRKIESGKIAPNNRLAQKLQHALRIQLLVTPQEPELPERRLSSPGETTLGDVVPDFRLL